VSTSATGSSTDQHYPNELAANRAVM